MNYPQKRAPNGTNNFAKINISLDKSVLEKAKMAAATAKQTFSSFVSESLLRNIDGGAVSDADRAVVEELECAHGVFLRLLSEGKCPDWLEVEVAHLKFGKVSVPRVQSWKINSTTHKTQKP